MFCNTKVSQVNILHAIKLCQYLYEFLIVCAKFGVYLHFILLITHHILAFFLSLKKSLDMPMPILQLLVLNFGLIFSRKRSVILSRNHENSWCPVSNALHVFLWSTMEFSETFVFKTWSGTLVQTSCSLRAWSVVYVWLAIGIRFIFTRPQLEVTRTNGESNLGRRVVIFDAQIVECSWSSFIKRYYRSTVLILASLLI